MTDDSTRQQELARRVRGREEQVEGEKGHHPAASG
jgi:hypothetical protein